MKQPDGRRRWMRAGQGCSWGLEDYKAAGEELREFKGSRSQGHVSGFKGTELMQVSCFGFGRRSDSYQRRVSFAGQLKVFESRVSSNPAVPFTYGAGTLGTNWYRSELTWIQPSPKSAAKQGCS